MDREPGHDPDATPPDTVRSPGLAEGSKRPDTDPGSREFERFFELSRDLLCFAGVDGYFKRVNPSFVRVLEFSEAELLSRPFIEFVHPEDRAATLSELSGLVDGQETHSFENRYRTKRGVYRWFEWSARPTGDGDVYAIARDVTESRHALAALKENEQRFRDIAEHIAGVFYIYGAQGRELQYVSPAFDAIWGRSGALLYGDPDLWGSTIVEADRERVAQAWARCPSHGAFEQEYSIERPDGDLRRIWDRAVPIRAESGEVKRVVGIAEDISLRRAAEDRARGREAELAHVARLSTLGELASGIAHELNQPLSAIATLAESCRLSVARESLENTLADLEVIAKQAERAGAILRRMRNMVRRHEPSFVEVDLSSLVREVVGFVEFGLGPDGVTLAIDVEPGLAVQGDSIQLQQVLMNLLQNAIQAVESSAEKRVEIRARGDDSAVVLEVSDTGPGIQNEMLARIFEPFFTTKKSGLGIGLAFSQSIAEAHGGSLHASSDSGGGTTFEWTLPLQVRDDSRPD